MKNKYLEYKDMFVTCFHDQDKYLMVMVNDKGSTRVVDYDSNFFSVEDLIIEFDSLLFDSFEYQGKIRDCDIADYNKCLQRYINHIKRQLKGTDYELNWEYLKFNKVGALKQ